ncbi:MAG: cytochrome C biogenesis protein [Rhodovulum sulfidophilum]|uniref:Cytochrome C biogenesis protein n=1 Tax=Rhodovulum sulfidophilum TaxID=35806 RepID=A0A2W5MW00_RHOSU|nr:MAG: cytochrome C biogenesis protein [Rhodovulum sulfidophilum]
MTLALAFLAGLLSILSPCVLPLLPIVLGAAVSEHRFGPAALAAGLTLSFTVIGLFVATIGFALGLDGAFFRALGGVALVGVGLVLLVPAFQTRFAMAAAPVSDWADRRLGRHSEKGLGGQFGLGLVLGAVWAPCVGPTLGAASLLAATGEDLGRAALTMAIFGLGASLPLLGLGVLSRETLTRWRGTMRAGAGWGKGAFGALLVLAGGLVLSGLDKALEAEMIRVAPSWLVDLTTRF